MHRYNLPRKVGTRTSRSLFGPGARRSWGLEDVVLPPQAFPVTTAHALHDLLLCETDAITKSLARSYKRHHKLPKPPEQLSKFSLRASLPPPRKPHYFGGSRSSKVLGKGSLLEKSPVMLEEIIFSPTAHAQEKQAPPNRSAPAQSIFQLKGLKTQGTRATILDQLEQYRLNSQARMQLKQRAEIYMIEKHEKYLSKQSS